MRVSGKITHSFYCFLRARGFDVSRFFQLTALEMEFLKDSSRWLPAGKVESLLKRLSQEYAGYFVDQDFIMCVGRACFDLGAWGELDSVLKMRTAQPVFSRLPVFMSYFVEGFTLVQLKEEPGLLSARCNVSSKDYPFITEYLRSVIESLPLYTGENRAAAKWVRHNMEIRWEISRQTALFPPEGEMHFKPELLRDFRRFLDNLEKEMILQKETIKKQNQEITRLKNQLILKGVDPGSPPLEPKPNKGPN